MQGASPTQAEPKAVWWGTNPANLTAAVTDVAPFTEAAESRTAGTSSTVTTTTTNDTYQVTGTITSLSNQTIGEAGLSDTTTKPTAVDAVQAGSAVIGSSSATTLVVASGAAFTNGQSIQIRTEVMTITGIASNTLTVTRAANGSTAISTIAANDVVTAGNLPGSTATTNGSHYCKSSYTGLALSTGDSIAYTFQVAHS
jgi:hypothetical protein